MITLLTNDQNRANTVASYTTEGRPFASKKRFFCAQNTFPQGEPCGLGVRHHRKASGGFCSRRSTQATSGLFNPKNTEPMPNKHAVARTQVVPSEQKASLPNLSYNELCVLYFALEGLIIRKLRGEPSARLYSDERRRVIDAYEALCLFVEVEQALERIRVKTRKERGVAS